ncbi:tape measure protein [Lacticaseibacillus paracasei]|uniref:tape measure protein n=1 Tax=Lacticaseibacillus paracasei TaxID=1597 RepID=UPI001CBB95A0|nr:tape measure protein [Lacticaseibacillus paracasei]MBZ3796429.1 tape measure protein [Lacticaseibacillus paracasei]
MIKVAQQINATMSTKIALDLLSASESVKSLTAVVRSSQNAWKAQEAEMKSAGDAVGAAQAKYDGLGKSIEAQQSKIDALKAKQAELKGNTADVAQQYLKYQQQIDGANKQLASMQAQQDRSKQAMDYQKSGLAGLQQEYTAAARANQVYVTRLEAEGKQQEANKAKMDGYKSSITNLNEQLSKQSAELDKIASASGKDSEAWRTQKTRVDETATSLAKAKSSMTGLQTEMDKANPSVFNRVKEAISGTNKQAEKTPGLLHKIVEGGLITNAITSGWQRLSSSITDTVKSGLELNEAGEKLKMTWENMGKSANDIQILSDQMSYLRSETGATGGEINNMQTTVDTMTHGVTDKTLVISAGIASIATASHKGGDGMDSLSKAMTRVVASGNLTTTNLAKLEKQAPTLGAQLAKAAGVSQDSFAKMVADGKIKSDDFMNLVYKVGTTSRSTFDQFGKTSEGAIAQLSGSWTSIKAKMAAPLLDVKNSGMQSLAGILTSSVVQSAATALGKGMATIANWAKNVLDYISAHKKDVTGIAGDMWDIAKIAGEEVWSLFKTAIKDIAGWLNVGGSNAKTMKDPLKAVHDVLDDIVKNKSGIQTTVKVIAGLWMTKKALEFAAGLGHVYSGLKALGDTKLAQSILSNFSKLNIGSKLAKIAVPVVIAYDAISDLKDLTKAFGKHGTVGQKFSAVGETSGSLIGGGIGFMLGGPAGAAIGATIGKVAGKWAGNAAKKFTDGWNAKKKPANSWLGGLGWDARQMTNNVVKWWDGINKSTDKAQKKQQKQQEAANKRAQKEWNGFWGDVGKGWTRFWNDVNKKNSSAQQQQKKQQDAANKQIKKDWDSFWSNASKGWNSFWSDTLKNAKNGMNDTKSRIDHANTDIHKGWDSFWSDTSKNWNGFWGKVGKNAKSGMSTVHGWINDGNSKINSGWRSMWSGLKSFFGGIWDGMKHAAQNGMNAVINVINGAISGINWVWEKFTGKDALKKLSHVHFANGGVVKQKMHLVMVNDGAGPDWKELYQLPNGQIGMSQQRNATGLLPEGTRVFNGKETKAIMNMAGVEHYDLGGVIGGVGKFFSGAWDKLEAVGDWLANPVGKVTDLIKSSISGISGGVEMFSNLAGGVINKLTGSVVDWFKKELTKLQDTLGANPGGSGVQRWKPYVIQALKANGFDASAYQVAAWMRVIQRESNGNPRAINLWDSNAKAGIPSMGLVQTIGPTFNAYKFPGHNDVYNGYDDLLAGIHYMKAIYGSGSSAFARVSGPEGYANGGLITQPIHALVGEDGPETILPLTKTSRAWQLLGQAVTNINHNLGNGAVAETKNSGTDDLGKKLDNIADLLTKLSFVLQVGDDQFYPKVAPKVKQYNDRTDRFNAYWKGGTV